MTNLLANARVHTGAGHRRDHPVGASTATHAVLSVIDNGPGIPEQLQSEVFERFARGDTSRSRKGGSTGLGLAIVSAVVKAHNGTITLDSAPGHTDFTVRLPPMDGRPTARSDAVGVSPAWSLSQGKSRRFRTACSPAASGWPCPRRWRCR